MKQKSKQYNVGVIIGRFQVAVLHKAHKELIDHVCKDHSKVIIFLGVSPVKSSFNNPLDFEARKSMILKDYPNINVLYLKDVPCDICWSNNLDEQIKDLTGSNQTVCLYGSRDSFILHYKGKYDCIELEQTVFVSGSEQRNKLANTISSSVDFRHGAVFSVHNKYPACIPTVDVAIFSENKSKLLLGRKQNETKYRFIGGYVDPGESFEIAAKREALEETGLELSDFNYIGSYPIDDWRYRSEKDKITTLFYTAQYTFGKPEPKDDIIELKWFEIGKELKNYIVDEHLVLFNSLIGAKI